MARRQTPAARALVGALALGTDKTINNAFKLAGYRLIPAGGERRFIVRNGRTVGISRHAGKAAEWLRRVGRKLEALGIGKAAA